MSTNDHTTCAIEDLRKAFSYDPETGVVTRRITMTHNAQKGDVAGTKMSNGYLFVCFKGMGFLVHRVAFAIHYGRWPAGIIDHKDTNRSNNRISNLRDTNKSGNGKNMVRPRTNTSGRIGVSYSRRHSRWQAYIHVDKKRLPLGWFRTMGDAIHARREAEAKHGYIYNRPAGSSYR